MQNFFLSCLSSCPLKLASIALLLLPAFQSPSSLYPRQSWKVLEIRSCPRRCREFHRLWVLTLVVVVHQWDCLAPNHRHEVYTEEAARVHVSAAGE